MLKKVIVKYHETVFIICCEAPAIVNPKIAIKSASHGASRPLRNPPKIRSYIFKSELRIAHYKFRQIENYKLLLLGKCFNLNNLVDNTRTESFRIALYKRTRRNRLSALFLLGLLFSNTLGYMTQFGDRSTFVCVWVKTRSTNRHETRSFKALSWNYDAWCL